ncbi:MAG: hypothetical protein K2N90_10350 [Lachnospiraceae bacterium]|nr:hypothetical protein [Lachnospiraceae bacterium]
MNKADEKVIVSIKNREPFCEPFIKLSLILKTGGVEADGYLGMCGDRISNALLVDGEDVRIDFVNFPDMELTAAGVRICREILECYVSEDIIADAHEALCEEKATRTHINIISQTLREMNLYGLVRAFIESDARIRQFVVMEICQRFILIRCFRAIRNVYYNIGVRIKYRGLLSICSKAAAAYNGK